MHAQKPTNPGGDIYTLYNNGVLGPRIWLPNTENFFRELVDLIRTAEQIRTHCDSPDFYCRRLEEYERTLSVLTTRITESYTTEQFLINNLHTLCTYLNSLRNEFDVIIVENYERTSERFSLEEPYDRAVCTAERQPYWCPSNKFMPQ